MNQKVTINPSIARIINIDPCSFKENNNVYFTADENITGTFVFRVWNSDKKNSEFELLSNPISIFEKKMTLGIKPETIGLPIGNHYHEIWHLESNRIYYKGEINVIN
jgi:hypothetical protein